MSNNQQEPVILPERHRNGVNAVKYPLAVEETLRSREEAPSE